MDGLEELGTLGKLVQLDEVLGCLQDELVLVLLLFGCDCVQNYAQLFKSHIEVLFEKLVVCRVQMHVHAFLVNALAFLQGLYAFDLSLRFIYQIRHTYLRDAGIGLGDVPLNLRLRSH